MYLVTITTSSPNPKGINKMSDLFKTMFRCVMLKCVPWNWLVYIEPRFLKLIPNDLKTQDMCNGAIEKAPWLLNEVSLHFRTQEMCESAVEKCLHPFRFIPNHLKTQEMCEKATEKTHISLVISLIVLKPKVCMKRLLKMNQKS